MDREYSFKNLTELNERESDEVLLGRNDAEVRRWMKSDRIIAPDEHRHFIASLKVSSTQIYLRVERNGKFAGVYSLTELRGGSAIGGFWITDYARQRLLGPSVVFQSIQYVFDTFAIKLIRGYQLIQNEPVAKLNAMLGFEISEVPVDNDPRMRYLVLSREKWFSRDLWDGKLLKLIEMAERRNEH